MVSEAQRSRAPIQKLADSDPIKKTTPGAIKALHELGLKVIMATGAGWDCQGDCAQPGCDEKYPPKSIFRLCLQRHRRSGSGRHSLPVFRNFVESHDRGRGDGIQFGVSDF